MIICTDINFSTMDGQHYVFASLNINTEFRCISLYSQIKSNFSFIITGNILIMQIIIYSNIILTHHASVILSTWVTIDTK